MIFIETIASAAGSGAASAPAPGSSAATAPISGSLLRTKRLRQVQDKLRLSCYMYCCYMNYWNVDDFQMTLPLLSI